VTLSAASQRSVARPRPAAAENSSACGHDKAVGVPKIFDRQSIA